MSANWKPSLVSAQEAEAGLDDEANKGGHLRESEREGVATDRVGYARGQVCATTLRR